jgi:hypothetical protein
MKKLKIEDLWNRCAPSFLSTVSKTNLSINFTEDKLLNPEIPQFLNPKTDFLLDKLPYQHISM